MNNNEIKKGTVLQTKKRLKSKVPTLKNLDVLQAGNVQTESYALISIKAFLHYCTPQTKSKILDAMGSQNV